MIQVIKSALNNIQLSENQISALFGDAKDNGNKIKIKYASVKCSNCHTMIGVVEPENEKFLIFNSF